jgi:hypothetical protein
VSAPGRNSIQQRIAGACGPETASHHQAANPVCNKHATASTMAATMAAALPFCPELMMKDSGQHRLHLML